MTRKYIPVEEAAKEWFKDPAFVAEYDALEEEFALAEALIKARAHGRTMPSTRTLMRYAEATGTRLRISFDRAQPVGSR